MSPSSISDFEVRVTFPGKVVSASGTGVVSDNTVVWSDPAELTAPDGLVAVGEDGIGFKAYVPYLVGIVVVLGLAVATLGAFLAGRARRSVPTHPLRQMPPETMVMTVPPPDTSATVVRELGPGAVSPWARPPGDPGAASSQS